MIRVRSLPEKFRLPPPLPGRHDRVQELELSVTTLLYGGGAQAGNNDIFDPFRVASIRGHLRFWWRATLGSLYPTVAELLNAESRIWGSTAQASPIKLRILSATRGREVDPTRDATRYVLFPAVQDKRKVYAGGQFKLEVRLKETERETNLEDAVSAALWGWINFGGIGGRTRRGCGSLFCSSYSGYGWLDRFLGRDGVARDWPVLRGGRAVVGSPGGWLASWEKAIEGLQSFRQQRTGNKGRGRTVWPEPDSVRIRREKYAPQHRPVKRDGIFPRGALGLPIIFHFKDHDEPRDNTLNIVEGRGKEEVEARFASPVIIKPWAYSATQAMPLLIALNTKPLSEQLAASQNPRKLVLRQTGAPDERPPIPDYSVINDLVAHVTNLWHGEVQKI